MEAYPFDLAYLVIVALSAVILKVPEACSKIPGVL